MELIAGNPRNSPEARKNRLYVAGALWVGGFAFATLSAGQGWLALIPASLFTFSEAGTRFLGNDRLAIRFDEGRLWVTRGNSTLWSSSIATVKGVKVVAGAKKWGVVVSPPNLEFDTEGGDRYAVASEGFDGDEGEGWELCEWILANSGVVPIITHTSNSHAAVRMELACMESAWPFRRVVPYNVLDWIEEKWVGVVMDHLEHD